MINRYKIVIFYSIWNFWIKKNLQVRNRAKKYNFIFRKFAFIAILLKFRKKTMILFKNVDQKFCEKSLDIFLKLPYKACYSFLLTHFVLLF